VQTTYLRTDNALSSCSPPTKIASGQRGDVHDVSRSRASRGRNGSTKRKCMAPLFKVENCIVAQNSIYIYKNGWHIAAIDTKCT
jgi:hypothetical protein